MEKAKNYFILMADIKGSRIKDGLELMTSFKKVVNEININCKSGIDSPLTITLGDEFQGIAKSLHDAILIMIDLEETIVKYGFDFKLRYVLNFDSIETPINKKIAYGMLGDGLTRTRESLENLKSAKGKRFNIRLPFDEILERKLNLAFLNFQNFIDSWRIKDHRIIYEFINGMDYKDVAKKLSKDTSSMWRKKESLDIEAYIAIRELILLVAPKKEKEELLLDLKNIKRK